MDPRRGSGGGCGSARMVGHGARAEKPLARAVAFFSFPGLSAGDLSTVPLRKYLDSLGYATEGWNQGLNLGPRPGVLEAARQQVIDTFTQSGNKVSLIGWSLARFVFRLDYLPNPSLWLVGLAVGMVLVSIAGWLGAAGILRQPALPTLRAAA